MVWYYRLRHDVPGQLSLTGCYWHTGVFVLSRPPQALNMSCSNEERNAGQLYNLLVKQQFNLAAVQEWAGS